MLDVWRASGTIAAGVSCAKFDGADWRGDGWRGGVGIGRADASDACDSGSAAGLWHRTSGGAGGFDGNVCRGGKADAGDDVTGTSGRGCGELAAVDGCGVRAQD